MKFNKGTKKCEIMVCIGIGASCWQIGILWKMNLSREKWIKYFLFIGFLFLLIILSNWTNQEHDLVLLFKHINNKCAEGNELDFCFWRCFTKGLATYLNNDCKWTILQLQKRRERAYFHLLDQNRVIQLA